MSHGFNPFDKQAEHDHHISRSQSDTVMGIVSDAKNDPKIGPVVRVTYPDCDGKVSAWLPVLQKSTVGTSSYHLPRLRERVLVQKLPNSRENGVVIGAVYSTSTSNPVQTDPNNHGVTYDDGSTIHMNTTEGNAACSITKAMDVNTGGNLHFKVSGNTELLCDTIITITATGAINIKSGTQVNVTAPMINANGVTIDSSGNVSIPGTLFVQGNVRFQTTGSIGTHLLNDDGAGAGS